MKKTTILLVTNAFLLFFISFTQSTYAQKINSIRPTIQQKRDDLKSQRCTVLTQNIDRRINRFNNNKERHINQYNTTKQRLSQLVTKLQQKGYDVTQLQTDGKIWDGKIQKFGSDFVVFINKLTETKNVGCGQSDGAFRTLLNQARQQLVVVHQDSVDARTYYQTVIKKDIEAIRNQNPTVTVAQ